MALRQLRSSETATAAAVDVGSRSIVGTTRLGFVVLLAGSGSLAVEIAASRLLAPYFGSSTVVWANIIGLILIYLSAGYWLGGRIADRHASPRHLAAIILAAALAVAVLPFVARPVLGVVASGLEAVGAGAVAGSFFTALALFAIPVTLLGMVSPYAIRLALPSVNQAGSVSGRLYAVSTIGSILGTFIPALLTIPLIGTQRTMLGTAAVLALAAALLGGRRFWFPVLASGALIFLPSQSIKPPAGLLFESESQYQYIQVTERDHDRRMSFNEGIGIQSDWHAESVLTGGPWDMFLLTPGLTGRPVHRVLIIGNAGGTIARGLAAFYPGVSIDGVEIDPMVSDAGRRFMGLGKIPQVNLITADGRQFLRTTSNRYDLILIDAYNATYIPFYIATQEFFDLVRSHLEPDGLAALNVASVPDDRQLSQAVGGTMAAIFPQVWDWRPLQYNELLIGLSHGVTRATLVGRLDQLDPSLRELQFLFDRQAREIRASRDPMTDDHAPVEWMTDRAILQRLMAGSLPAEQPLPTRPVPH